MRIQIEANKEELFFKRVSLVKSIADYIGEVDFDLKNRLIKAIDDKDKLFTDPVLLEVLKQWEIGYKDQTNVMLADISKVLDKGKLNKSLSSDPSWIGVDLDGTLAEYHEYKGPASIGKPITKMVDRVKEWVANNKNVKIMTARANPNSSDFRASITAIKKWCKKYIGKELPVVYEKDLHMAELWDDRAIQIQPNTGIRVDGLNKGEDEGISYFHYDIDTDSYIEDYDESLSKSQKGPFIGPRGGKWADPEHTIPWKEGNESISTKIILDKLPNDTIIKDKKGFSLSKWDGKYAYVETTDDDRYYARDNKYFDPIGIAQKYNIRFVLDDRGNPINAISDSYLGFNQKVPKQSHLGSIKEVWVKKSLKDLSGSQTDTLLKYFDDKGYRELTSKVSSSIWKKITGMSYDSIQSSGNEAFINAANSLISNYKLEYDNISWNNLISNGLYGLNKNGSKITMVISPKNFNKAIGKYMFHNNLQKAVWSNAHMNDLPDSAFLYIESGGKKDESGKTVPRSLRHFPYRGMDGKIDLAHTRNAIARIPQSKCGLSEQQKVALQNRARKYLGGKEMEKAMFCIGITNDELNKADRGGKYIRKVPKKGGGYVYFYENGKYEIGGQKDRKGITSYIDRALGSADGKKWLVQLRKLGTYDRNKAFNKLASMAVKNSGKALNSENKQTALTHLKQKYSFTYNKSLENEETEILETFLKSTIEDNSLPVIGKGKEQGDQELDGKGKSSGNPGNGSAIPDRGVSKPSVKKLSEDDEVDEKNMKDHKKPIENITRKSLNLSTQAHDYMAREVALRKGQLMKNDMVYIEPDEPIQKSVENKIMTSDEMAVRSMQNESFYKAHLMNRPLSGIPLSTVNKCRHCSNTFSKAITVCPNCGRM